MPDSFLPLPLVGELGVVWVYFAFATTVIIHIGFAIGVYADSGRMRHQLCRGTFLVGGGIWALATLMGGVFIAAVYWLIHHSNLSSPPRADRG